MADKMIQEEHVEEIIAASIRESSLLIPTMPQKAMTADSLLSWQKKQGQQEAEILEALFSLCTHRVKGGFKDTKYSESEIQSTECAHLHRFFIPKDLWNLLKIAAVADKISSAQTFHKGQVLCSAVS